MVLLGQAFFVLPPRRPERRSEQPLERPLPRVVVHLVGAYLLAARAAAIDGPRAPLDLHLLRVALVGQQERAYGGPLLAFLQHAKAVHRGRLSAAAGHPGG